MGLAAEWNPPPSTRTGLRALVELRQHEQRRGEVCFGRLEAVLSRHWPEFGEWMDVREQKSALRMLATYPSPARVRAEPEMVKSLLREASRARLSAATVEGVVAGTQATLGVPMMAQEERLLSTLAMHALEARERADGLDHDMLELARDNAVFARLQPWMGTYTAAVIITLCDPLQYAKARQLEKACGLNLREKSSGEYHGRLSITKRGPGLVRQLLYLFALRMLQESSAVRAWYVRRRGYTEESKRRAVVAVMRKLVRALFHVDRGATFDASKLFDLRRLELEVARATAAKKVAARTTPRAFARGPKRRGGGTSMRAST